MERTREERETRLDLQTTHVFALNAILGSIRDEPEYERNGRNGMTLVKDPDLRVVLEAVKAGGRLSDHYTPGRCTLYVLAGEICITLGSEEVYLRCGELMALPPYEQHAVEAVTDSVFLLTIAPIVTLEPNSEPTPLREGGRD